VGKDVVPRLRLRATYPEKMIIGHPGGCRRPLGVEIPHSVAGRLDRFTACGCERTRITRTVLCGVLPGANDFVFFLRGRGGGGGGG